MKLLDVYATPGADYFLWQLLTERTPEQSISHKAMPSFEEHQAFVATRPYLAWYLIVEDGDVIKGACYLSKQREIGVFVFRRYAGHGYGRMAVDHLMSQHPGNFLANVAPGNTTSRQLFESMGFTQIQVTYEKENS